MGYNRMVGLIKYVNNCIDNSFHTIFYDYNDKKYIMQIIFKNDDGTIKKKIIDSNEGDRIFGIKIRTYKK